MTVIFNNKELEDNNYQACEPLECATVALVVTDDYYGTTQANFINDDGEVFEYIDSRFVKEILP